MCFSEKQSYLNTLILIIAAIYNQNWRLKAPLIFLAIKDLIQGLLYRHINNKKILNILTTMSWIHICFQPLFVNILVSHFSDNKKYFNKIFVICLLYGLYSLTTLKELNINNDPSCIKKNKEDDFCSKKTTSYIGKYHIAYKFSRDNDVFYPIVYYILMFVPALFTKAKTLIIIWLLFVLSIFYIFRKINSGEIAALWCFLSIVCVLPISLFEKNIIKLL